jgi:hypothetical protein
MNSFIDFLLGTAVVIVFLCAVSLAVADEAGSNNLYPGDFLTRSTLTLKMDTGQMGLWPGGFLTVEERRPIRRQARHHLHR